METTKRATSRKVDSKKRIHHRNLYMAVNFKGGAVAAVKQLPVFWRKSQANKVAKQIDGKAVKVSVNWQ